MPQKKPTRRAAGSEDLLISMKPEEKTAIRMAAAKVGVSMTAYIVDAATRAAEKTLKDGAK